MTRMPTIFVSHGAPTLVLEEVPARAFLAGLAASVPRPRAVLAVTAHWTTAAPVVSAAERPATVHDYYGFPDQLYALDYPAPGAPELAERAAALLADAGLAPQLSRTHGRDHGSWVPLMLMYPAAEVPVAELSVQPGRDLDHHLRLGRALAPLRDEGVLVLGSGGLTHNLREFFARPAGVEEPVWVSEFAEWVNDAVIRGDEASLAASFERAPHGRRNHPTPEHFLPLLVAAGAGGGPGRRIHQSADGVLRLDAFLWDR
jgi:4,5-DOPA dioxygenase extradiol